MVLKPEEVLVLNRARLWVRVFWPIYLILKFSVYAFVATPTHFMIWDSGRFWHAFFYLFAAMLVLVTVGQTPSLILEIKALLIFIVAFCSAIADLVAVGETSAAKWNSVLSWVGLIIANQLVIKIRLTLEDERGRG